MYSATQTNIFKNDVIIANLTKHPNFNIYSLDFLNDFEKDEWVSFYYKNFCKWFDKEKFPFFISQDEFIFCLIENSKLFNEYIARENPEKYFEWKREQISKLDSDIFILESSIHSKQCSIDVLKSEIKAYQNRLDYLIDLKNKYLSLNEV